MTVGKKSKVIAATALLLIGSSVIFIQHTTIPSGPWEGIYPIFAPAWIVLCVVTILLVAMPGLHRLRILGAALMLATISLMTFRWQSMFATRDPWIHLGLIRDGNYLTESRYPVFHGGIETFSVITGIPADSVVFSIPLFTTIIGTLLLAAVALRLTGYDFRTASISVLVLSPTVAVDFNERPIALVAVCVLSLTWLSLAPIDRRLKSTVIIAASIATLLTHPLIFAIFILLAGSITICNYISGLNEIFAEVIGSLGRELQFSFKINFVLALGTIFAFHFFYWLAVGQRIIVGTITSLLATGNESSTASTTGSTPLLYDIPAFILEASAMAAVVITTGSLAIVGYYLSYRRRGTERRHQFIAFASIFAAGCLVMIFVLVDLFSPIGFPAIRAVPLAPILLIPGAIIGIRHLDTMGNIVIPVFVVVLLIGLLVMFPSPLTGTMQQSSTPSDVERTHWIVEYQGGAPVIEAENTYQITHAYYGSSEIDRISNDNTWAYQSTTREESYPWEVERSEQNTLVVNHDLTRLRAAGDGEQRPYEQFELESGKIYSGGNSDIYWSQE